MFNRYIDVIVFKRRGSEIWTQRGRLRAKHFRRMLHAPPAEGDADWAIVDPAGRTWSMGIERWVKNLVGFPFRLLNHILGLGRMSFWIEALILSVISTFIASWINSYMGWFK